MLILKSKKKFRICNYTSTIYQKLLFYNFLNGSNITKLKKRKKGFYNNYKLKSYFSKKHLLFTRFYSFNKIKNKLKKLLSL